MNLNDPEIQALGAQAKAKGLRLVTPELFEKLTFQYTQRRIPDSQVFEAATRIACELVSTKTAVNTDRCAKFATEVAMKMREEILKAGE